MDTTYFGRDFGVMAFMDSRSSQLLYKQYVKHETTALYLRGIAEITRRGICIQAIICDGRKGVLEEFERDVPVQMCQFHQVQIVVRYLTRKPKTEAAIALRKVALSLTKSGRVEFTKRLDEWQQKWGNFMCERSISPVTEKTFYTHKKLRSAYFSLRRNLPRLFTCEAHKELDIPNTTNKLDGTFADLKNKLRNHNGLSLSRKKKFIDEFFKA